MAKPNQPELVLTKRQARQFLLRWQGLYGPRQWKGPDGVMSFIRRVGCLQFDPVDLCGKNAEIVLLSRVTSFQKPTLDKLLYRERLLAEHWDKNLSIYPADDWPFFARNRAYFRGWYYADESRRQIDAVLNDVREAVRQKGIASSQDLAFDQKIDWPWAPTKLSRAALEYLYFTGELCIHHRKGAVRWYAPAGLHLPQSLLQADDPHPDDAAFYEWYTLRRISALGLLWNRASGAFLGIPNYSAAHRSAAFASLLQKGKIHACRVEGIATPLYYPSAAAETLETVLAGATATPRLAFIAPLDNLMWDRKLIAALFGFDYKWEIYTPAEKRQYGPYTLPVLYGAAFAGRIDLRAERDTGRLVAGRFWPQAGFRPSAGFAARLQRELQRFARFNGCTEVRVAEDAGLP